MSFTKLLIPLVLWSMLLTTSSVARTVTANIGSTTISVQCVNDADCDKKIADKRIVVTKANAAAKLESEKQSSSTILASSDSKTISTPIGVSSVAGTLGTFSTPGGCGIEAGFLGSASGMSFDDNLLSIATKTLTKEDFDNVIYNDGDVKSGFRQDKLNLFAGFTCPELANIKDATIPGETMTSVSIKNINFYTGSYMCEYRFQDTKAYYELQRVNKACKLDTKAVADLPTDLKALPKYSFEEAYGIISNTDQKNSALDELTFDGLKVIENFDKEKDNLIEKLERLKKSFDAMPEENYKIDLQNIDSHTNASSTLSSIIVGILTGDAEFLNTGRIIIKDGSLNLKEVSATSASKNGDVSSTKFESFIENPVADLFSLTNSIDKKFWGFYFYLIANINNAFGHIITMLFGLGTVGIFGFAYIKTQTQNQKKSSFQFDFGSKAIGIFTAFTMFSAPIIPVEKGIPSQYIYSATNQSSPKTEEIKRDSTVVQVALRYSLQLGTYWSNVINDYAFFSYLNYVKSAYGHYDTSRVVPEIDKSIKSFISDSVLLKKQINFFEYTCGYNYFSNLKQHYSLPDFRDGSSTVNSISGNPLGYNKSDYAYCSRLFKAIQADSYDNLLYFKNTLSLVDSYATDIKESSCASFKDLNDFLPIVLNINN
ncbi:MAG: hypothetical protein VSS52_003040 [Thiotrichaceae bacterium]|nr:hypothetical protein [Thiotrichaceae bacterium]